MSAYQTLQQGIQAIQSGDHAEGEGLLQTALQDATLKGRLRATALNWLAEISAGPAQKRQLYNAALEADPANEWAEERLADLLQPSVAAPPPPLTLPESENPLVVPPPPAPIYVPPDQEPEPPPATLPEAPAAPPSQPGQTYPVVGILNGPNGPGSGFFLTSDGIIVTTRFVTGPLDQVTVELEPGRQIIGQVVRSFPSFDIALIHADYPVETIPPETAFELIQPGTAINYAAYGHAAQSGHRRDTGRRMPPHLFPTDIVPMPDAGGGPVLNAQQERLGMLTRNISSSSSYVYGVHIGSIRRCLETYYYELRSVSQRVYCPSCGYASAAVNAGGHYCETCGTLMPQMRDLPRERSPHMAALYGDSSYLPCTVCGAQEGFYEGLCLRCGQAGDPGSQRAQAVEY